MTRRWRRAVAMIGLMAALATPTLVAAHAEPRASFPPIDGAVESSPPVIEIQFSEEIGAGTTVEVVDAAGVVWSAGASEIDLDDVQRLTLRTPLKPALPAGIYTVRWTSVSMADGDSDSGEFAFTVGATPADVTDGPGTPVAAGSPAAAVASGPTATATLTTLQQRDAMLRQPNEYDSRAFGIAVLVGIGFAVAIYLFWRLVRPKPGERRK